MLPYETYLNTNPSEPSYKGYIGWLISQDVETVNAVDLLVQIYILNRFVMCKTESAVVSFYCDLGTFTHDVKMTVDDLINWVMNSTENKIPKVGTPREQLDAHLSLCTNPVRMHAAGGLMPRDRKSVFHKKEVAPQVFATTSAMIITRFKDFYQNGTSPAVTANNGTSADVDLRVLYSRL